MSHTTASQRRPRRATRSLRAARGAARTRSPARRRPPARSRWRDPGRSPRPIPGPPSPTAGRGRRASTVWPRQPTAAVAGQAREPASRQTIAARLRRRLLGISAERQAEARGGRHGEQPPSDRDPAHPRHGGAARARSRPGRREGASAPAAETTPTGASPRRSRAPTFARKVCLQRSELAQRPRVERPLDPVLQLLDVEPSLAGVAAQAVDDLVALCEARRFGSAGLRLATSLRGDLDW